MQNSPLNIDLVKLISDASPFAATLMDAPGFGLAVKALEEFLNTPSTSVKRSRPARIHMSEIQGLALASKSTAGEFTDKDIEYVMNVIQNIGLGAIKCADYKDLDAEHSVEDTLQLMKDMAAGNPHAIERAQTLVMFYKLNPKAKLHPTPSDEALASNPMAATAPKSPSQMRQVMPVAASGTESVEDVIARAARPRSF